MLATILFSASCKKQDQCVAHAGGNLNLKVFFLHRSSYLVSLKNYRDTVYVKFNVQDFPGIEPSDYDETFFGEVDSDYVLIPNVSCGNYFIYGVAMDPYHFSRVTGGIPWSTDQAEGETSVTIPLTE